MNVTYISIAMRYSPINFSKRKHAPSWTIFAKGKKIRYLLRKKDKVFAKGKKRYFYNV